MKFLRKNINTFRLARLQIVLILTFLICSFQPEMVCAGGKWLLTGSMNYVHSMQTATRLSNGQVLVTGGGNDLKGCELYAPDSRVWTVTGAKNNASTGTATLLQTGNVLWVNDGDTGAEIYDSASKTWKAAASTIFPSGQYHTATLLPDGKVLVTGGMFSNGSSQLYNPGNNTWTATGSLNRNDSHTATLLLNGKVLAAGGISVYYIPLASAELYDENQGTWSPTGAMNTTRFNHTATLLTNGKVLVVGGRTLSESLASCELYDPGSGAWSYAGSLNQARHSHTATLLPNGKVLVTGGRGPLNGSPQANLTSAEIYDPVRQSWSFTDSLMNGGPGTATLLPNGRVLATVSGYSTSEVYIPAVNTAPIFILLLSD